MQQLYNFNGHPQIFSSELGLALEKSQACQKPSHGALFAFSPVPIFLVLMPVPLSTRGINKVVKLLHPCSVSTLSHTPACITRGPVDLHKYTLCTGNTADLWNSVVNTLTQCLKIQMHPDDRKRHTLKASVVKPNTISTWSLTGKWDLMSNVPHQTKQIKEFLEVKVRFSRSFKSHSNHILTYCKSTPSGLSVI